MKWTLVAILSVPAFVMGSLSIFGLTQGIELFLWLGFAAGAAGLLAKYLESRLLIHTLLVGLLWGLVNGVLQSLFFPTYLANNPAARKRASRSDVHRAALFRHPRRSDTGHPYRFRNLRLDPGHEEVLDAATEESLTLHPRRQKGDLGMGTGG